MEKLKRPEKLFCDRHKENTHIWFCDRCQVSNAFNSAIDLMTAYYQQQLERAYQGGYDDGVEQYKQEVREARIEELKDFQQLLRHDNERYFFNRIEKRIKQLKAQRKENT